MTKTFSFILVIVLFSLDQSSKWAAREFLTAGPIDLFPYVQFLLAFNPGIAFSLSVPLEIIFVLTAIIVAFLSYQIITQKLSHYLCLSYILILAGALGNLSDRIIFGAVTDFIAVWNFPIFNLADTWVSLGVCCFLLDEFYKKKLPLQKEAERNKFF